MTKITTSGTAENPDWDEEGDGAATFALTVTKVGTGSGTVRSTTPGIKCGADCTETYAAGTTVTLTASVTPGSTFVGWSGGCTGTGPCVVTMSAAKAIRAKFNLSGGGGFALTVSRTGAGSGTVKSTPAGIKCGRDCAETYPAGTLVTLSAAAAPGSSFARWSGACTGTGPCVVTLTAARAVKARFDLSP